jgi:hypothetical protein
MSAMNQPRSEQKEGWLRSRPWLWVCIGFAAFLAGWFLLFRIASQHRPEELPPPPATQR